MKITKLALLLCLACIGFGEHAHASDKPNILIIFTDDQRADTVHALGNPSIITPNIDKLAKRSFVYENAYCYGGNGAGVCVPSRNQLMTGNVWHRWDPELFCNPEGETFPKVMKAAGYETFYREKSGSKNNPVVRTQFDHYKDINTVAALMTGRAARGCVDDALKFLESERDANKPFFMYLGVAGPHDPRYAEKRFRDQYDPKDSHYRKTSNPCTIGISVQKVHQ